jgi:hypothetical protein
VKDDKLVVVYKHNNRKYAINILKLFYDPKQADGSELIDAYRQWYEDNESFFKRRR